MTAVTADRDPQFADGDYAWYNTASGETIYAGTLVMLNASGLAIAAVDNSACVFAGVACGYTACGTNVSAVGTIGVDGSAAVKVRTTGSFLINYSGTLTLADLGTCPAIVDNATLGPVASASGDVRAGRIIEVPSATTCRVNMNGFTGYDATSASVVF